MVPGSYTFRPMAAADLPTDAALARDAPCLRMVGRSRKSNLLW